MAKSYFETRHIKKSNLKINKGCKHNICISGQIVYKINFIVNLGKTVCFAHSFLDYVI